MFATASVKAKIDQDSGIINGTKKVLSEVPWQSVAGGLFWGSCTLVCGLYAIELFAMGGPFGLLGGIIYVGFTALNGWLCYHSIDQNRILPM